MGHIGNTAREADVDAPTKVWPPMGWAVHAVSNEERDALAAAAAQRLTLLGGSLPLKTSEQSAIGRAFANEILPVVSPKLCEGARRVRSGELRCLYATGLPTHRKVSPLIAMGLGYLLGELFNYSSQNGGDLVMRIACTNESSPETSTTREAFGFHTLDAIVPIEYRARFIGLFGFINVGGTVTGYAAIDDALVYMQPRSIETLLQRRYSVRAPHSFRLGDDLWSEPRSILTLCRNGRFRIAWPTYATRLLDPEDRIAAGALQELRAALDRIVVDVPIDPGCWLAFDNVKGLVRRSSIGPGPRLVYRTYSIESLEALRRAMGETGPIFDLEAFLRRFLMK
jgi:hypothetical protein